jgi:hypothetical protein
MEIYTKPMKSYWIFPNQTKIMQNLCQFHIKLLLAVIKQAEFNAKIISTSFPFNASFLNIEET